MVALSLALALAAPLGGELAAGWRPSLELDLRPGLAVGPISALPTVEPRASPSPCQGDICQPRVAVLGFEPRYSMRGKKTELFLRALDRARLEPFASWAYWLAATGLRLDARPRTAEGPAHLEVFLRLRIDAWGRPVPLSRPKP